MINPIIEEIGRAHQPLELFNILKDKPYNFFLDSSFSHERFGRYSFLGCDPFLVFKSKKDEIILEWNDGNVESLKSNPFSVLKDLFKRFRIDNDRQDFPFISGGVGYFSYDLKDFIEELPDRAIDDLDLPDCILGFYDCVVMYDSLRDATFIISSGMPETDESKNTKHASQRLKEFKDILRSKSSDIKRISPLKPIQLRSNFSKASYMYAISQAKSYIKKGNIYQVNLSQRFEAELDMAPSDLYLRLRQFSPAPFSSYLDFKDVTILSSSPERFLLKKGDYIETRPIKGTRPRGEDKLSDSIMARELVESVKDNAEHIMIVDLERNDLGRICDFGSVKPTESVILEKYTNVFHLVSTVSGRLKKDVDPIDCLLATFPGGSITGAPKIRSMEIIEELEPVKRSIYTGAIGYISFDGNMDTSIVIRTFVVKEGRVYFSVGGGIVADSIPEYEYNETIHKARGMMEALGITIQKELREMTTNRTVSR